jgi:hypothetical protein
VTTDRITLAQNLTAIVELAESLEDQAVNDANDRLMPGGLAMVALGSVANLEAWANKFDAAERRALQAGVDLVNDDEDDWEPPLQTLLFWSEDLRRQHNLENDARPTVASEANVIRWALDWMWDNEPHWDDFAKDIKAARSRLEALLAEGLRARRGVPCLSLDCDGTSLIQPVEPRSEPHFCDGHEGICTIPHERCAHDRGGLRDEWVCPSCDRRYGTEDYTRAVAQSALLNAEWLSLADAMARTGAKRGSIQGWATKGDVRRKKDFDTGRTLYSVPDIQGRVGVIEVVAS